MIPDSGSAEVTGQAVEQRQRGSADLFPGGSLSRCTLCRRGRRNRGGGSAGAHASGLRPPLRSYDLRGWRYIVVHAEQIARIVASLDLRQPRVVAGVDAAGDAILLVGGHEVDVDAAGGVRRGRVEERARPPDARLVLRRRPPARMDVQDEMRTALRKGGG